MLEFREDLRAGSMLCTDWTAASAVEKNHSGQVVHAKIRIEVVYEFINNL